MRKNAVDALHTGIIADRNEWNKFCTALKTYEFADDLFDFITAICDACEKYSHHHHHEEHDSCCKECAKEKEHSDNPVPFEMKNYYHFQKRYYDDDTDIWFEYNGHALMFSYEKVSTYELEFDINDRTCACCGIALINIKNRFKYIV